MKSRGLGDVYKRQVLTPTHGTPLDWVAPIIQAVPAPTGPNACGRLVFAAEPRPKFSALGLVHFGGCWRSSLICGRRAGSPFLQVAEPCVPAEPVELAVLLEELDFPAGLDLPVAPALAEPALFPVPAPAEPPPVAPPLALPPLFELSDAPAPASSLPHGVAPSAGSSALESWSDLPTTPVSYTHLTLPTTF